MNTTAPITPLLLFKALADESPFKALILIQHHGELCVCELMQALEISQPKLSRHLALLRKAGILQVRRQHQWKYYSLHPGLPPWCHSILNELIATTLFPPAWQHCKPGNEAAHCAALTPGAT